MAEKRISVRLAAVGGRQVRAELEGVGEAGSLGFGRLSREMEAANARLAAFSRRVRVAAAAVAAAAAAGVSMGQVEQATVQLTRRLSQAASGAGPAAEALRRLRLSAEDLQRLPLDARIAAIQQALGQYVPGRTRSPSRVRPVPGRSCRRARPNCSRRAGIG